MGMDFAPFYWVQEGIYEGSPIVFNSYFSEYRCELLRPEDIPNLLELTIWPEYSGRSLTSMFEDGKICISAKYGDQIAAFMWIDLEQSNCKWYRFPLKKNEAYLFDMFTLKAFRGKGVAPYLRYKSYEILKDMGRYKCYSYSDSFNKAAIKFKRKLNARFLKVGIYLTLSRKYRWILDKEIGAKGYQLRFLGETRLCYP
jgi:hypothetical protein